MLKPVNRYSSPEAPRALGQVVDDSDRPTLLRILRSPFSFSLQTDYESAVVRVGLLLLALLGTLHLTGSISHSAAIVALSAFLCGAVILRHVIAKPGPNALRRILGILLDQGYCFTMLWLLGEPGAILLGILVVTPVGAAFRFGHSYGWFAGAIGVTGLAAVLLLSPYLRGIGGMGFAWVVALGATAAYAAFLARRNEQRGKRDRRRANRLANRAQFMKLLEESLNRAKHSINPVDSFAVLYCDLDGFKAVNDTHGHDIGDLLLKQVGDILGMCVRSSDTVSRLGGDEFAVLLSSLGDAAIARRIGEDIVNRVKSINYVDGRAINISCSVGIAMARVPMEAHHTTESVLKSGDEAMYLAKRSGKNRCHFQMAA
jgi:diguanylate cyclase (GGDEF)-like protein